MPDAEAEAALKQESGLVAMTAGGSAVPLAALVSAGLPEQLLLTLQQSCQQDDGGMQQMAAVGIPALASLGQLTHHHHHHHQMPAAVSVPQFILAGGQLVQGIQGAQLLIPTSSGMATQHILTVPLNQAVASNQTVQMLTANGQIVNLQALTSSPQMLAISQPPHQQLFAAAAAQPMVTAQQVPLFAQQQQQPVPVVPAQDKQSKGRGEDPACRSQAPQAVTSTSSADEAPAAAKGPYPAGTNATISQTDANTVDGINLEEIKEFARAFKMRRLSLGLTQTQVGQALSVTEGPAYSQSAICRFEKLDITPKSAQKIKPVLERWMKEAEQRYRDGAQNLTDFMGSEPSKKRKRRTSFTPQALDVLNAHFERSTHPSGSEMTELAEKLNYDREVVRVWFCNKRQALKNTIKKLKTQ